MWVNLQEIEKVFVDSLRWNSKNLALVSRADTSLIRGIYQFMASAKDSFGWSKKSSIDNGSWFI